MLASPWNMRVVEVLASKNLYTFCRKNFNPFCLKNLKTFTLSLRNAALILTSVFEGFRGLTSNENFRGSSKNLKFLSKFYSIFQAFLVNFSRFFEDSSKNLKNLDLILTSGFEDFWGWIIKNLKIFAPPSASKNPQNFWKPKPQPQKNLKFRGEIEDPHFLRSHFTTQVWAESVTK